MVIKMMEKRKNILFSPNGKFFIVMMKLCNRLNFNLKYRVCIALH
jgi:hypothetical protein